jgi:dTDP-4-amino-4,6-dideoxygalactose transaminase
MNKMLIPLTKPDWGRKEERAVVTAMQEGIGTGDGPNVARLEKKLQNLTGAKYALATTSCTHALELAVTGLGLTSGQEVILPSFTMTSTANAVVLKGAKPVFADIDPTTYNIDPQEIRRKITGKTVGIIVVHYAGMPCEMMEITKIAEQNGLWVVEDAAHAIGAKLRSKALGTFGKAGCFSFHGTKNIACGEGGAVVTNDPKLASRMEIYRANGTNRKAFLEGTVDKYSWVSPGTSFFLSDILASLAHAQLNRMKEINRKRQLIASSYLRGLKPFDRKIIHLPVTPKNTFPNWHIFAVRFNESGLRKIFQKKMRQIGIEAATHYVPLHSSLMGKANFPDSGNLPNTDQTAETLIRLPIYPGLSKKEISYILECATKVLSML